MSDASPHGAILRRQLLALARQDLLRSLRPRRMLPVVLLIGMPLLVGVLRALFLPPAMRANPMSSVGDFAGMFNFFILRFVVFFGAATIFFNLVRGQILDRTIHYRMVAPLRREHLILGSYLGGLAASLAIFLPTTLATLVLFFLPHGRHELVARVLTGQGLLATAGYLTAVALACLAYGALFLAAGMVFRNPMIPAALYLGWEATSPFLPKVLKVTSIFHHLMSFSPVPLEMGQFALVAEPTPRALAAIGLILAAAILLAAAAWRARSLQVSYSSI